MPASCCSQNLPLPYLAYANVKGGHVTRYCNFIGQVIYLEVTPLTRPFLSFRVGGAGVRDCRQYTIDIIDYVKGLGNRSRES